MELLHATASTRDVYQLCITHAELLRHTAHPAVQRVAHALRSFKNRHKRLYSTPASAFPAHWQLVLSQCAIATPTPTPTPTPTSPPPPHDVAPAPPCSPRVETDAITPSAPASGVVAAHDDNQCLLCYQAPATVRLVPCGHDAFCGACMAKYGKERVKQHRARRIRLPNLEEEAVLIPCPVCRAPAMSIEDKAGNAALQRRIDTPEATWQRRCETLEGIVRQLRGLISQQTTPEKLESKLFSRGTLPRLRVVPIVGDGRCLFYTLLHSRSAMQPITSEADELRARLRAQLDGMTDEAWERRVPQHARDIITRAEFADRYLNPNRPTAHVPIDCIALWQDLTPDDAPDVYVHTQAWVHDKGKPQPVKREHVEVIRATSRPAKTWMLVQLTFHGGGHFQLITLDDILVHSRSLQLMVEELDKLVEDRVEDILGRKDARRKDVRAGRTKRRRTDEVDDVVE